MWLILGIVPLRHWQSEAQKAETKKNLLRNTQGVHAAMRLNMEQTILSQYRRLPGFHSEFMGLEIMSDAMTTVGVEDFLNGVYLSPGCSLCDCMHYFREKMQFFCSRLRSCFNNAFADPRESMEAPIAMHEGMERLLGIAPVEPFHHAINRPTLAMRPL
jgi:hypothetical protein